MTLSTICVKIIVLDFDFKERNNFNDIFTDFFTSTKSY